MFAFEQLLDSMLLDQTLCTIKARLSLISLPRDIQVTEVQNMQISFDKKTLCE